MATEPRSRWGCALRGCATGLAGALVLAGTCWYGHDITIPAVHGVVVNSETGKPIAGATVFRWASVRGFDMGLGHGSGSLGASDWTSTDAEGRFEFDRYVAWRRMTWFLRLRPNLGFTVIDPCFGEMSIVGGPSNPESGERLEVRPSPRPAHRWDMDPTFSLAATPPAREGDAIARWNELKVKGPGEECPQ